MSRVPSDSNLQQASIEMQDFRLPRIDQFFRVEHIAAELQSLAENRAEYRVAVQEAIDDDRAVQQQFLPECRAAELAALAEDRAGGLHFFPEYRAAQQRAFAENRAVQLQLLPEYRAAELAALAEDRAGGLHFFPEYREAQQRAFAENRAVQLQLLPEHRAAEQAALAEHRGVQLQFLPEYRAAEQAALAGHREAELQLLADQRVAEHVVLIEEHRAAMQEAIVVEQEVRPEQRAAREEEPPVPRYPLLGNGNPFGPIEEEENLVLRANDVGSSSYKGLIVLFSCLGFLIVGAIGIVLAIILTKLIADINQTHSDKNSTDES